MISQTFEFSALVLEFHASPCCRGGLQNILSGEGCCYIVGSDRVRIPTKAFLQRSQYLRPDGAACPFHGLPIKGDI
jgi:hypothetical protein